MKTNTPYIFILSFLLIVASGSLAWYVREEIGQKIEIVRAYNVKEKQNKNFEFGTQLRSNTEILSAQEQTIKKVFLDASEVIDFITELETTAKTYGIEATIEKVVYGTPETIAEYYTIKPVLFNVQLTGPYTQAESFIANLKKNEKILLTNELKIYKTGDIDGTYTIRIIIEGTILSQ